ncbi:MAG TPA: hypothetical protein DEO98_05185 [Legionellales bacterium]|nr:hypothetical protein [Legionellales bacterium]
MAVMLSLNLVGALSSLYACTTIIIGKKASQSGKIMIARNSDTIDARRAKNLKFYTPETGINYIGLPYYDLENDAQYDMAQVTTNQQGVSLSATQTIQSNATVLKLDAYHISKLGAAEPNIPSIVMPYAHSATQAVDILGRYIEQYGVSGKKGFGVLFADAKNAWYLETLSGHQWVAIRIPDEAYFVGANGPGQIQEYLPEKYHYKWSHYQNKTPIEFAEEHQIAQYSEGVFNFRKTFADVTKQKNPHTNFVRLAYIQHQFNPSTHPFDEAAIHQAEFATFLIPEHLITLDEVKKIQASHYEDYQNFDPYLRANKKELKRIFYYPIANIRTSNAHVTVVDKPSNEDFTLANVQYIALGMPTVSVYLPIYHGLSIIPDALQHATAIPDDTTLFWQFRKLQTLIFLKDKQKGIAFDFRTRIATLNTHYHELNQRIYLLQQEMARAYQATGDKRLINAFTQQIVDLTFNVNKKLINHFMQMLKINEHYGLTDDIKRQQWFAKKLRQQDCGYRMHSCKKTFQHKENKFVDEPIL